MNNFNLGKKMVLLTILMNVMKGLVFFTCTITSSLLMALFLNGNESDGALITKIMVAAFIITLKALSVYKKVYTERVERKIAINLIGMFSVDVLGMIALFFVLTDHLFLYLSILGVWTVYGIVKGILSYRKMGAFNLGGFKLDEQLVNSILGSSVPFPSDDSLLIEDDSVYEEEKKISFDHISDEALVESIYLYAVEQVGNRTGNEAEQILRELDPAVCCIYFICCLIDEVKSGGLRQYFTNAKGFFLFETLRCLEEIEAGDAHTVLNVASDLLAGEESALVYKEKQLNRKVLIDVDEEGLKQLDEYSKKLIEESNSIQNKLLELALNELKE